MVSPAKKRGWDKIEATRKLTLMVGEIREKHSLVSDALQSGHFSEALDNSLQATLRVQELSKLFRETRLGKHGYDLRALIKKVEEEDRDIWSHALRTTRELLNLS